MPARYSNLVEPKTFSRRWWLDRGRSALWVLLVTVLVWIWADVEFTDEMDLGATLHLAPAQPDRTVLLSDSHVRVTFKVRGRRSSLERLDKHLRTPGVTVRHEAMPGEEDIDVREVLNNDAFVRNEGLTVLSASPRVLRVRLDRKVYQPNVPVNFEYSGAFPSRIEVDPPRMGIHVAESDWQSILKSQPEPALRTVRVDLKSVEPGRPFPVEVIRQIGEVSVEPDRPNVMVTVEIAELTETESVTTPVQVIAPPSWMEDGTWRDYVLKRQDPLQWRVTLQVNGPRKDLDKLKAQDVQAFVLLTDEDKKPVSWLTREVQVRLPRGLSLELIGPTPTVTFKLERTNTAGGP